MTDALERIQALGFTDYESRAYLALLGEEARTGYEVAKAAGMPRANVYPVLERLVERGAARCIETADGRRYAATPADQLLAQLERAHRRSVAEAREALAELEGPRLDAPVFNLNSRDALLAQADELLAGARERLLVATQPPEAAALAAALAETRQRGVHVTTLCMEACERECGGCVGDIHRYDLAPRTGARWLLLVADGRRMLAGEIQAGTARAIATEQPLVVEMAAAYIRQSLALATLCGGLGGRFDGLLSSQARAVLDALHTDGGFESWCRQVLGREAA